MATPQKEELADLSQFHRPGFDDEVPLVSRELDLDFLPVGKKAANEILLAFALKFLNAVIAYEPHATGYFAAITIWRVAKGPLVPHLFVWCGALRELAEKLWLHALTTPFATQTKKLVKSLRLGEPFEVLEDTATIPKTPRVFIAPARPPYRGFAALETLCRPAKVATRRRLRA